MTEKIRRLKRRVTFLIGVGLTLLIIAILLSIAGLAGLAFVMMVLSVMTLLPGFYFFEVLAEELDKKQ